ncbi:hypothetical protein HDU83_007768 [Entophlyctis luteolus]|nr:hypothetical protein HDU83_007768 [Entophlyctis luteolus]
MPNFRLPAWLKVSIGCVNGPHDLPVISIFGLTSRPGAAATDRSLTVAKKHTEIVLSETVDLFDRALRIRQEAVRLTVYDEAGIAETIAFVLDARSGMSQSAFDAKWGECVLWISLRGSVSICGFSVFKGVLPAYAMNLRDLRGSADQASPTVHVFEGNDIALPSKQLQEQSNSISSDPAVAIERRPPGFSGLFPGIRFDRTGMNNEGLQLTVNCSLSFSYPPAVGLSFHEIEFGVYLNKKMITSGLINPLRIESCRTTNCIFSITFNNPRTLRKGLNLTSLIIDTTGLISRALGFGIGAIETVAFGTMRSVAGVEVSSTVGIKVLAVRGYGPTGEIVELPWLARMLASLEFGEVPVFGEKAGL